MDGFLGGIPNIYIERTPPIYPSEYGGIHQYIDESPYIYSLGWGVLYIYWESPRDFYTAKAMHTGRRRG